MGNNKYKKPKAAYTLGLEQRRVLCQWFKDLKMPDGHASRLSGKVDMGAVKLTNLKSHDCHVILERLLPIALRPFLPKEIWEAITDLSCFFRDLCSTTLREQDMFTMSANIPAILCKLEMIFPPSFFDSMEHLPVHLPYEVWAGGPVQFRWMYPFERYLGVIKRSIKQKARIEGSICQAYLYREMSFFASYYFKPHVQSLTSTRGRHDERLVRDIPDTLSVFNHPGEPVGAMNVRWLDQTEITAATLHVLINCSEIDSYVRQFQIMHDIEGQINHELMTTTFASWFKAFVSDPANGVNNRFIIDLAGGPNYRVRTWNEYKINGNKFQTRTLSEDRTTYNCGVCVKGDDNSGIDDWYGIVEEILELEYAGIDPLEKVVLFRIEWYDPTIRTGKRVIPQYKIVELKAQRRYQLNRSDPFILAQKAIQMYPVPYPSVGKRELNGWIVPLKCRPLGRVTVDETLELAHQDTTYGVSPTNVDTTEPPDLRAPNGGFEVVHYEPATSKRRASAGSRYELPDGVEEEDEDYSDGGAEYQSDNDDDQNEDNDD